VFVLSAATARVEAQPKAVASTAGSTAVVPASKKPTPNAAATDATRAKGATRKQAQTHFWQGKRLLGAGQFEAALEQFTLAHALVVSPNTLLYRARCLTELGRLAEAHRVFDDVITLAAQLAVRDARYAKTLAAARSEQAELAQHLAFVRVVAQHASAQARLVVNGRQVPPAAWLRPIAAAPGSVEISLASPGGTQHRKRVVVRAGDTREVVLDVGSQQR
jgi:tetratricopeptide (TPR) repeat protein